MLLTKSILEVDERATQQIQNLQVETTQLISIGLQIPHEADRSSDKLSGEVETVHT